MNDAVERLLRILTAEERLYVRLRDLLQRERELMVHLDADGLEAIAREKEEALMADLRGEMSADVTASRPLSDAQVAALSEKIKTATGRDVKLDVTVDEGIIGGLIVKVGSRMIDTSIRSRLNNLQNAMKEVG